MTSAQGGGRGVPKNKMKMDKGGGGGKANLDVILLDDIKLSFATTQLLKKDHF